MNNWFKYIVINDIYISYIEWKKKIKTFKIIGVAKKNMPYGKKKEFLKEEQKPKKYKVKLQWTKPITWSNKYEWIKLLH